METQKVFDLRDGYFEMQENAAFVTGVWGDPWVDQFNGAGPSSAKYQFKAAVFDGVVYVPDPAYLNHTPKNMRDWANCPMVRARVQPPTGYVKRAGETDGGVMVKRAWAVVDHFWPNGDEKTRASAFAWVKDYGKGLLTRTDLADMLNVARLLPKAMYEELYRYLAQVACDMPLSVARWRAMTANGQGIVTVSARTEGQARAEVTRQLDRDGRRMYLTHWQNGGEQLVRVDG
jgi:hypothetical protein